MKNERGNTNKYFPFFYRTGVFFLFFIKNETIKIGLCQNLSVSQHIYQVRKALHNALRLMSV